MINAPNQAAVPPMVNDLTRSVGVPVTTGTLASLPHVPGWPHGEVVADHFDVEQRLPGRLADGECLADGLGDLAVLG